MTRIAYVDGRYVDHSSAATHIEDRGYQLADGVYEYMAFYDRHILDADAHLERLESSLAKLEIAAPMPSRALKLVMQELIARNTRNDGGLYLQVSRGIAKRDHAFPAAGTRPMLVMTVCASKMPKAQELENGVPVITHPDIRWGRCDIKSLALLPNVLAKQAAVKAKAREAWLFKPDGKVTEGCASNAYIITKKDGIITHPADHHILPGITRDVVLALAKKEKIKVTERAFTVAEAKKADEAFLTSTSPNVLPVVSIDGIKIGNGKPGPITQRLMEVYYKHIHKQTGRNFA